MDERSSEAFELTPAERELVRELSQALAAAIESASPRLVVATIDLEVCRADGRHLRSVA